MLAEFAPFNGKAIGCQELPSPLPPIEFPHLSLDRTSPMNIAVKESILTLKKILTDPSYYQVKLDIKLQLIKITQF